MPYIITPPSKNLELEKNLKNADTYQEKQKFLKQVKYEFYKDYRGGDDPLLIPIEDAVKEAGLNKGWQSRNLVMFYDSLKSVDFPMGEIHKKRRSRTGE